MVFCRYTFASGSADNIKQWMFPDGNFIQNLSGHNAIINTLAVNSDGVLVSGGTTWCHQDKMFKIESLLIDSQGFLLVNIDSKIHVVKMNKMLQIVIHHFCSLHSRQWNHPHVGLEDGLQLPADSCRCTAWISGQWVGHFCLHVRQLREPADHRRGRQDHQSVQRGWLSRKFCSHV